MPLFAVSTMVIMTNIIQAGWNFDQDDSIIDSLTIGTTSSFKKIENTMKNDGDMILAASEKIHTCKTTNTDEEGWTTTIPGKKKPKKNNNRVSSTESIIMTIDGNVDQIEAGALNRINVTSPGRKYRCNIPDDNRKIIELDFNPTAMTDGRKEQGNTKHQEDGEEGDTRENQSNTQGEQNNEEKNGKKNVDFEYLIAQLFYQ